MLLIIKAKIVVVFSFFIVNKLFSNSVFGVNGKFLVQKKKTPIICLIYMNKNLKYTI